MYFLEDGDEFFVRLEDFVKTVSATDLDTSAVVKLTPKVIKKLPHRKRCRDYTTREYLDCLLSKFKDDVINTIVGNR